MIEFTFRVCHSFLVYPSHPITIPRYLHPGLRALLALGGDAWISLPMIGAWQARIYGHTSSWGPYYQIRLAEYVPLTRVPLDKGTPVRAQIFRAEQRIEIHVRRFTPTGQLAD